MNVIGVKLDPDRFELESRSVGLVTVTPPGHTGKQTFKKVSCWMASGMAKVQTLPGTEGFLRKGMLSLCFQDVFPML